MNSISNSKIFQMNKPDEQVCELAGHVALPASSRIRRTHRTETIEWSDCFFETTIIGKKSIYQNDYKKVFFSADS
jgi:hypothetical protein